MIVVDDAQLRALPGAIEMYRAALALMRGDIAGTVAHARRVLAVAPDDDELGRAAAHALLGLAAWSEGDLDTCVRRVHRLHRRDAAHRPHRRHPRVFHRDGRHPRRPRPAARRAAPVRAGIAAGRRPRGRSVARHRRHARRSRRDPARARRPRRRGGSSCDAPRSSSCSARGSIPTARGQCAPGCCWRKATRPAASRCWKKPSGSTTPTSPPPCARSARAGRARYVRQGDLNAARAWVRERGPVDRRRAALRHRVRAHHVGDHPHQRRTRRTRAAAGERDARPAAGGGRGRRPRQQRDRDPRGAGAGLRRARRHRERARRAAAGRSRSPSPRATSGSSPSSVRGCRRCGRRSRPARPGPARSSRDSSTRSATASSTCCGCCAATSAVPTSPAS